MDGIKEENNFIDELISAEAKKTNKELVLLIGSRYLEHKDKSRLFFNGFCNLEKLEIAADLDVESVIFDEKSAKLLKGFSLRNGKIKSLKSILDSISSAKDIEFIDLRDNNIEVKSLEGLKTLNLSNLKEDFYGDDKTCSNFMSFVPNKGELGGCIKVSDCKVFLGKLI